MKNLVIVESPTKAKTIGRFLGKEYAVKASMGHLLDLPKSKLGVDVEHDFSPQYDMMPDKKKIIAELKLSAKTATDIILATDPDREGEAIAAHVKELLAKDKKGRKFIRIVFHEITKEAIEDALKNSRDIDLHLVEAQTARRVLDRLVGYKLSPILWRKVRRGLSAGRVQSVALRLIVEREKEIEKFVQDDYWTMHAAYSKKDNKPIVFDLIIIGTEKIEKQLTVQLYDGEYKYTTTIITTQGNADNILADMQICNYIISSVSKKETNRSPVPAYTTSTLQQDGARRLGFAARRTMRAAQKLYEEGFITYHRTDSVVMSASAINAIRNFIQKEYGSKYVPSEPRYYQSKQKLAQEAHEAIRPTSFINIEESKKTVAADVGSDGVRLYELIWRRAVASQMPNAVIEATTVLAMSLEKNEKAENKYTLKTNGSILLFDGFLKANPQALADVRLPDFAEGETVKFDSFNKEAHKTQQPPRYNDASLIATLEEKGIGRPSTYAPIISTIEDRRYVEKDQARFIPTAIGVAVNDFLVKNFSDIDDIPFTAEMEDQLDAIANGQKDWVKMMQEFYTPFEKKLESVKDVERVKIEVEETDQKCEKCGSPMVIRTGRFGKFLSCSRFPDCDFKKSLVEETGLTCPKDGGKIIIKKTRKGRRFYGCSNYPTCTFAAWKLEDIKTANPQ